MGIGPHEGHMLKLFAVHVRQGFGHTPHQVGSSLTKKSGWRDVDVRLILPDDEYSVLFGDPSTPEHLTQKWVVWNLAWTALGRQMTRLPIDFQIQSESIANGEGDEYQGPRSALFFLPGEFEEAFHAA